MSTDTSEADAPVAETKNFSRTPTSWDTQDDILLMHLKDSQKLGWKEIASHFHNRTPNACQFRWRRLKSGNLKNPPKSTSALSSVTPSRSPGDSRKPSVSENGKKGQSGGGAGGGTKRRISELSSGIGASMYSPMANSTFTGYDTVSTALAGLNALSSTSSTTHISAPTQGPINTTSHPQTFDNSPKSEASLDPQAHGAVAGTSGGYFTDISVDPTSNLPHNKPHPVPNSQGITPRNSTSEQNLSLMHNNSIIQIARDDRNSVSSQSRLSVSSLPSKSMDIPHHHSNSLAHMPILFGGSSISGPAGAGSSSISGPSGLSHLASNLSSIRNGSIVGPSQAYLRRSSMSIVHNDRRLSEKDRERKTDKDKSALEGPQKRIKSESATPTPSQPIFKIPWSMEEDELLINRRRKELSFAELSILLPQRTEGEIWARIDALERLKNGHRASMPRASRRRRQSSLALDDDDDFYDEVDSVIGDMDSDDDDDDNDHVLVDVDDTLPGHKRGVGKRRASSAVNPLTVREGIHGKLH